MWEIGNKTCHSRLLVGTAGYPSLEILNHAINESNTNIVTVSLKRENPKEKGGRHFWDLIQSLHCSVLPNTAGCHNALEAIEIAKMAREIFNTNWIKLEIIADNALLNPDLFELVKAAEKLIEMGFEVFPFCTEDLFICQKLVEVGCRILMPWGAPIGSGKGILNPYYLSILRQRFPNIQLIVDAGIGSPIHAMQAMLIGYDGVLINSAIAKAVCPVSMAKAFRLAVESGKLAKKAGIIPESEEALCSTFLPDTVFWGSA